MKKQTKDYQSYIKELLLFHTSTLAETFLPINNCHQIKDLAIEIEEKPSGILFLLLLHSLLNFFV